MELTSLSLTSLLALYNSAAETKIKAFRDKPTALARLTKLLDERGLEVFMNDDGAADLRAATAEVEAPEPVEPGPAPTVAPAAPRPPVAVRRTTNTALARRGRAPKFADNWVILSVAPNPRHPSYASFARYALYVPGMTVLDYLTLAGGRDRLVDLRWDVAHGFIVIGPQ